MLREHPVSRGYMVGYFLGDGPKKHLPGDVQPDHTGAEARGRAPAGPQEVAAA